MKRRGQSASRKSRGSLFLSPSLIPQFSPKAGTNNAPVCAAIRADLGSNFQGDDTGCRKSWLALKKEFNPKPLTVLQH